MRQLISLPHAQKRFEKKRTIFGTLRTNKPKLPLQFTLAKGREIKSTLLGFQDDAMIASCCPKKNCVGSMLSTMHLLPVIAATSDKKSEVILYYNSTKGGVDTLDRMLRTYTGKKMT